MNLSDIRRLTPATESHAYFQTSGYSEKSMDQHGGLILHEGARRFEFGTRNLADQAGFRKALEIWETIGWDTVFACIAAYTDRMKAALQHVPDLILQTPLPYDRSSGIVTFRIPNVTATELDLMY